MKLLTLFWVLCGTLPTLARKIPTTRFKAWRVDLSSSWTPSLASDLLSNDDPNHTPADRGRREYFLFKGNDYWQIREWGTHTESGGTHLYSGALLLSSTGANYLPSNPSGYKIRMMTETASYAVDILSKAEVPVSEITSTGGLICPPAWTATGKAHHQVCFHHGTLGTGYVMDAWRGICELWGMDPIYIDGTTQYPGKYMKMFIAKSSSASGWHLMRETGASFATSNPYGQECYLACQPKDRATYDLPDPISIKCQQRSSDILVPADYLSWYTMTDMVPSWAWLVNPSYSNYILDLRSNWNLNWYWEVLTATAASGDWAATPHQMGSTYKYQAVPQAQEAGVLAQFLLASCPTETTTAPDRSLLITSDNVIACVNSVGCAATQTGTNTPSSETNFNIFINIAGLAGVLGKDSSGNVYGISASGDILKSSDHVTFAPADLSAYANICSTLSNGAANSSVRGGSTDELSTNFPTPTRDGVRLTTADKLLVSHTTDDGSGFAGPTYGLTLGCSG